MSEVERLRALLAEAREMIVSQGIAWKGIAGRIDAALAEPVADEPAAIRFGSPMYACLDCGYCDEGLTLVWQDGESTKAMCVKCRQNRVENIEGAVPVLAQERNEARAEIERLRGVDCGVMERNGATTPLCGICLECAFLRGAKAMREEAAIRVDGEGINVGSHFGGIIRALPIPEDEP